MNTGQYISGIGHIGLIGWLLLGDAFAPAPEPFDVTEVAVVSPEEYERIVGMQQPPETDSEAPTPPQPSEPEEPAPQPVTTPDEPPARPERDPKPETPPQDDSPDVTEILPPEPTEVQDEPPEIAPPPVEDVVVAPKKSLRPKPRPAPRVAPEPVAQPEPEAKPDEVVREEVRKDVAGETQKDESDATAPEEAAKEVVTEAEDDPSSAPVSSLRPKTRPSRPTAKPEDTATDRRSAIEKAIAEAAGPDAAPADTPEAPAGPPLTAGEKDALRVSVQRCWNTGSLSSDALRTTVIVGVKLFENGKPDVGSIRLVSSSGGSSDSARQAFEAARRAIIRCGASGYNLPKDKYAQWRDIEMTFNPEKMRIK